jgi:hypothetical protein
MAFLDLFRRSRPAGARNPSRNRVRVSLEPLENRWAPSGLDVLTPAVDVDAPPPVDFDAAISSEIELGTDIVVYPE